MTIDIDNDDSLKRRAESSRRGSETWMRCLQREGGLAGLIARTARPMPGSLTAVEWWDVQRLWV